jgi:hypothetical protein
MSLYGTRSPGHDASKELQWQMQPHTPRLSRYGRPGETQVNKIASILPSPGDKGKGHGDSDFVLSLGEPLSR